MFVVKLYVSPSASLAMAFSNNFRLPDHSKISFSLEPIRSVFVIMLIVGKLKRNLIDVARRAIYTKFTGVVINAPSKRNMFIFSSDKILSTTKRPLERYANNSICPGVSTIR